MHFNWSAGDPAYERIEIIESRGKYTAASADTPEQVTSFTLTNDELDVLYAVFRDNGFDRIRTHTVKTYYQGDTRIQLGVGKRAYAISHGAQNILVREDIDAWNRVVAALRKLAAAKVAP